jgi:cytochrome c553
LLYPQAEAHLQFLGSFILDKIYYNSICLLDEVYRLSINLTIVVAKQKGGGMVLNVVLILVLILLTIGFIALARGALRSRRGWVRWPGMFLSGLLALVFGVVSVVAIVGMVRLNTSPYNYAQANIPVTAASGNVAHGESLAHVCQGCHSPDGTLPLSGSKDDIFAGGPPFGTMYAPNLTPGGPLKDWSDAEIATALREGVDNKGKPLLIMPSETFHNISDADTADLIAYLRSQPAVTSNPPPKNISLLGTVLLGAGVFPTSAQKPITQPVTAAPAGTAEHGQYLATAFGCTDCHAKNFAGTTGGQGPAGPNITAIVPNWTQEGFVNMFHTGKDPTGKSISDEMPYKDYAQAFSDADLKDIYTFLHGLQPLPNNK